MNDLILTTLSGTPTVVPGSALEQLQSNFRGSVLPRGSAGYEDARQIHNMIHDQRPGLILKPTGAADVIAAVNFAREHQLLTAIRGGGHGVAGFASTQGGLMINMSDMRSVRVDPVQRTARAEAGALWGDLFHETQAFGLATTGGVNRPTGIAGLTLGGGHGFLMRSVGLTIDNLLSADVVTADGRMVTASATENADLFWGLRGAGHNFGIVTSFEYRLHPVGPMIFAGVIAWPIEQADVVAKAYADYAATLPDQMATYLIAATLPGLGRVICVTPIYHGPVEEGARLAEPLRRMAGPALIDDLRPMSYIEAQSFSEAINPQGYRNYWKSTFLRDLDHGAIEALVPFMCNSPHPLCAAVVEQMGGAVSRVAEEATAGGSRNAKYNVLIIGLWDDPSYDEAGKKWVRGMAEALLPFSTGSAYVNYLGKEEAAALTASKGGRGWGPDKYRKLVALKDKYDPGNLFRLNQNIPPSDTSHH